MRKIIILLILLFSFQSCYKKIFLDSRKKDSIKVKRKDFNNLYTENGDKLIILNSQTKVVYVRDLDSSYFEPYIVVNSFINDSIQERKIYHNDTIDTVPLSHTSFSITVDFVKLYIPLNDNLKSFILYKNDSIVFTDNKIFIN